MDELKPLIDATAYWVMADAHLRLSWSIFGMSLILAGIFLAAFLIAPFWPKRPKP